MGYFHDLMRHGILQNGLAVAMLASVACGIIGTYVVVRRITYIAGGIAHCVLGGIGVAVYLQKVHGMAWLLPTYGAVAAGLLAAFIIGAVSLRCKEREDTVISALWAVGMATGVLFIFMTGGRGVDPMSYLFGNIVLVESTDVWLLGGLDLVIVAVGVLFYHQFFAICFDREFSQLRGVAADGYYFLLLCLTALTIVLMSTVVGIVMVIAMLALPAAIASQFTRHLWQTMVLAIAISMVLSFSALAATYEAEMPAGPVIIVLLGVVYLIATGGRALRSRFNRNRNTPALSLKK